MKFFGKLLVIGILTVGTFSSVNAAELSPLRKLGRGISNVVFGVAEVPMKVYDVHKEEGGIAAITYGTLKGLAYFIAREVVGVVDIVTFITPLPNCPEDEREDGWGYGPLMRPYWVVDREHDAFSFIFQDISTME